MRGARVLGLAAALVAVAPSLASADDGDGGEDGHDPRTVVVVGAQQTVYGADGGTAFALGLALAIDHRAETSRWALRFDFGAGIMSAESGDEGAEDRDGSVLTLGAASLRRGCSEGSCAFAGLGARLGAGPVFAVAVGPVAGIELGGGAFVFRIEAHGGVAMLDGAAGYEGGLAIGLGGRR